MRLATIKAAEEAYRRALTLDPNYVAAPVNLGSLLAEDGRFGDGRELLMRAIEIAFREAVVRDVYAIVLRTVLRRAVVANVALS